MKIETINGVKVISYNQVNGICNYNVNGFTNKKFNDLYLGLCDLYNNVNYAEFCNINFVSGKYQGYIQCSN